MCNKITTYVSYMFTFGLLLVAVLFISTAIPGLNYKIRIVESGSMAPTIPTGSVVFITPADGYTIDDIVTFQRVGDEEVTTHRIVEESLVEGEEVFVTKGDANNSVDPLTVRQKEVAGLVWWHIPYLGFVFDFFRQPVGFLILVFIPALLVIWEQFRKIRTEVGKQKDSV